MAEQVLLRRRGKVAPHLEDYIASGGLEGLRRAREMGPEAVCRVVTDSGLNGRGGAAFPTGRKWDAVRSQPEPTHYVVLNGDESEPGTFKDRVLIDSDPFLVLEGLLIAAYATKAERIFLYVRGEYGPQARLLLSAVEELRAAGHLKGIAPNGGEVAVELRRGGGAYICGEETALFRSIEGYRGEPMSKPPFPTVQGLFRKPTVINNVETVANVPDILAHGADWYKSRGTARSTGTKLYSISGAVRHPDVYELPFGARLSDLLELAGAESGAKAVLLGGAAGTFVFPHDFDVELSYEGVAARGTTLGSGAVIVFSAGANLWQVAERLGHFFAHESCGQCVPCRVGTQRQYEIVHELAQGAGGARERALLRSLSQVMTDASICGLGQTASTAVRSLLDAEAQGALAG